MKKDRELCPICGKELNSPLARARGEHMSCVEKSDGETHIEK